MKLKTIEQHILDQQRKYPGASGGFSGLLYDIALAAKIIGKQVNMAGLVNVIGATGGVKIQGGGVQKMGKYAINMDPLDGSSNIGANVSIGTIFSIHRKISKGHKGSEEDCLQKGTKQACAGYVIYGSSTMLVYTTGTGVHGFTLDPTVGEFILSHENIQIPEPCRIYSVNEGNYNYWDSGTKRYIEFLKEVDKATGRPYTARY